jgi:carboxypeptidase Taq
MTLVLKDLREFLVPFLAKILDSKPKVALAKVKGNFPLDKQLAFNTDIAKKMGFDFNTGRLDISTHPFTTNFHPADVRITTRYREADPLYALGSTMHEVGHALYEQGLPFEHFGTPLAEFISLGIHESQSRMWENMIGRSSNFWRYWYPKLSKTFPEFKKISFPSFYAKLNEAKPALIRTEADEVTYNLHIIIRFEIERELIEGTAQVKDVPQIWRQKVKEYLGINVTSDREGCLQDVHWSEGLFGYFPTYSLGNLYAAQFYRQIEKEVPRLDQKIAKGDYKEILNWLRKNIHAQGKRHTASELVKKVTGEKLNSRYFTEYLESKYKELYNI